MLSLVLYYSWYDKVHINIIVRIVFLNEFSHQFFVDVVSLIFKIILFWILYIIAKKISNNDDREFPSWLTMAFSCIAFFVWNAFYIVNMTIFFDSNNDWKEKAPLLWGAQLVITIESTVNFTFLSFITYIKIKKMYRIYTDWS